MSSFFLDFNIWLQGMLFVLIMYHLNAFFFTKDKSFGIYAGYLFLVCIYLISKSNSATSVLLSTKFAGFFSDFNWIIQVWYWLMYTWFSLCFLDIKNKNISLYKKINAYIKFTFPIATIFFLFDLLFFNGKYMTPFFVIIYMPISLVIAFFFLRIVYSFKDQLNKFYVLGLVFFLGFSIASLYLSYNWRLLTVPNMRPIDFFMIGVFLEAITLSIGLAYKYQTYRKERDSFNIQLINQLKENEELSKALNSKLQNKVAEKTAEIEKIVAIAQREKIASIESQYNSQINELKLASLHNQMNPHFIFNALNSIKLYIINNDSKNAAHYLNKFSKLIRKILEASASKAISLQEELETMDLYMTIENIRFSNDIDFSINVDEHLNLKSVKVPPLVLQPFLENSIWHGLSSKKTDKNILMSIERVSADFVQIYIEDNGIGREASANIKAEKEIFRNSIGINLTRERLSYFCKDYKNDYSIIYKDLFDKDEKPSGTKVILKLPLV